VGIGAPERSLHRFKERMSLACLSARCIERKLAVLRFDSGPLACWEGAERLEAHPTLAGCIFSVCRKVTRLLWGGQSYGVPRGTFHLLLVFPLFSTVSSNLERAVLRKFLFSALTHLQGGIRRSQ
jgi:hypothetical protein